MTCTLIITHDVYEKQAKFTLKILFTFVKSKCVLCIEFDVARNADQILSNFSAPYKKVERACSKIFLRSMLTRILILFQNFLNKF